MKNNSRRQTGTVSVWGHANGSNIRIWNGRHHVCHKITTLFALEKSKYLLTVGEFSIDPF